MKTFYFTKVGSPRPSSYQEFFRSIGVGEFAQVTGLFDGPLIIRKDRENHCEVAKFLSYQEVQQHFPFAWKCLSSSYRNDSCLTFFAFEGQNTLCAVYDLDLCSGWHNAIYAFQMVPCPKHWKRKSHRKWMLLG